MRPSVAAAAAALALLASPATAAGPPPPPLRDSKRYLPPGPLNMGYAPNCNSTNVLRGIQTGLNVVFWFAINIGVNASTGAPAITGAPDLDCVAAVASAARARGLATTHMITVGGWDAPHPSTANSPEVTYAAWRDWNERVVARPGLETGFDGIDWDMEGFDDPANPDNHFTVACLELVGRFSQLAQADGYVVSLVPPESYLDPTTSLYDRSLLHAYPEWQPNFTYHGHNAYALLVSKFGNTTLPATSPPVTVPTFDFVSIQLYESWSHADYNITVGGQTAAEYLTAWVPRVTDGWWVDFASDPPSNWPSASVALAPSQLVIGLANGWAGGPKAVLITPQQAGAAYAALAPAGQAPRGFVFWDINDEGAVPPGSAEPLYMAAGINAFLHTRPGALAEPAVAGGGVGAGAALE